MVDRPHFTSTSCRSSTLAIRTAESLASATATLRYLEHDLRRVSLHLQSRAGPTMTACAPNVTYV